MKATALLAPALILLVALYSYVAWERNAPSAQTPSTHSVEALAGEVDSENRFQHTVLVTPFPSAVGEISKQCSGVVVSPRAILSAGHCFCSRRKVNPTGQEGSFVIDSSACATRAVVTTLVYEQSERGAGPSFQAREYQGTIRIHPGFKITLGAQEDVLSSTGDLAIISLDTPVDADLSPIPLASTDVQLNETVVLVGYGYDETFGTLGGRRRYLKVRIIGLPDAVGGRGLLEKLSQTRYKGDSGGPCLRETVQGMELVGILNRGLERNPSFTSTHLHGNWLKEELQRASISEQTPQPSAPRAHSCDTTRLGTSSCGGVPSRPQRWRTAFEIHGAFPFHADWSGRAKRPGKQTPVDG